MHLVAARVGELTSKLSKEGHRVIQNGKRFLVADFEKRIVHFDKSATERAVKGQGIFHF